MLSRSIQPRTTVPARFDPFCPGIGQSVALGEPSLIPGVFPSGEGRWEGPSRLRQEAIYGRAQRYSGLLKGMLWYSEVDVNILNKQKET